MDMDMEYRWRLTTPSDYVSLHLANVERSRPVFDAGMTLQRIELNRRQLRRMTLHYPVMTAQISAAIYYQALKLWWKKCPSYRHPKKQSNSHSLAPAASKPLPTASSLR